VSAFATVLRKEFIDNARDRRALSTALLLPLMGPLSLWLMFVALSDIHEKQTSPKVPVQGRANAPVLVGELERSGLVVVDAPADPEAAVARGDVDIVLVIPPSFDAALRAGTPAVLELIVDDSRQASGVTRGRVQRALTSHGARIGALRLLARGVDPSLTQAIGVAVHDVGTKQARAALLLASLPLFLVLACFASGSYVAIDVTAGERERGSLEALLMNPVRARDLVLAKVAATSLFGLLGVVVAAVGFVVAAAVIPFADAGIPLRLSLSTGCALVLLLLPVVVLGAAVLVFVGTLSRSFKTAQAAVSFVTLAPAVPGVLLSMFPPTPSLKLMLVPTIGHDLLLLRLLRHEDLAPVDVIAATAAVLLVAAALIGATTALFGPRLLAGR
jgi:sodium transport system permease protein